MKILLVSQFFQPEPIFKGLPLARELKARGHGVEVLTGFPNYPGGKIYPGYKQRMWARECMDGINVNRVPLYPSHDKSGVKRMANYLSFGVSASVIGSWLVHKPDVIYAYNLVTLGLALRLQRWFRGAKIVLDVQDLWPESIMSSGMMKSKLLMFMVKKWTQMEYKSPNRLIVLSPGFKENLVQRGVDPGKIDVIYNWCDESAINISSADRKSSDDGKDTFQIVFAGAMGTAQALSCIIDAATQIQDSMPHVRFLFIGGGVDIPMLKERSKGLGNVEFRPPVPQSEIGGVLSNADCLLVHLKADPVFKITIPSKIQAYLFAGKPILCGVEGDAADLVTKAKAGLKFEPENIQSFCNAIKNLASMNRNELLSMGHAGRRFYDEHLCFKKGVDQIEASLIRAFNQ